MYACFLIKILHVGKSRVANMRLALQSLGIKVSFLKTYIYIYIYIYIHIYILYIYIIIIIIIIIIYFGQ